MLVLSNYLQLSERLSELPEVDNISRHGSQVEFELCEIFLEECPAELAREIAQESFDTDEITGLLINFRENHEGLPADQLRDHLTHTSHHHASMYIDDMLGQVVRE